MDDPKYPYTLMDNSRMESVGDVDKEHRKQPPPYRSDYTAPPPTIPAYTPQMAGLGPATIPAPMPTIVHVNNVGAGMASDVPNNVAVGREPVIMTCPHCRCRNKTRVTGRATLKTHLCCLLLSCTGLCCLPYCFLRCRNIDHFCTTCDAYLGSYVS